MELQIAIQIAVGCGIVGVLWKLNYTVGSLVSAMKDVRDDSLDHETRIRLLEQERRKAG